MPGMIVRIGHALLTMAAMAFIAFALLHLLGDPIENMAGQEVSAEDKERLREAFGMNASVPQRFAEFVFGLLQGDLGRSLQYRRPVVDLFAERLPATMELVLVAAFVSIVLGVALGVWVSIRKESWVSRLILTGSVVGVSLPTFATGTMLIYVFAVAIPIFPAFGRGETVDLGWWQTGLLTGSGLKSLALPGITLGMFQLGIVLRLMRAEMLDVLRQNFILFARARGLPEHSVVLVHALRSAALPVVTVAGMNFAGLVAYSVITETVFQWPGLGLLFIDAVQFADVPLLAAYLVFVSALFVAMNLAVDFAYGLIDPRIRAGAALQPG
jgi:peptide/nickel transport system permease protein